MTDAAARDDRADRPTGWYPWLVMVGIFTLALRAIDDHVGDFAARLVAHNPWLYWSLLGTGAVEIVGLFGAGALIDRYGVRAVASVSLLVWAIVNASGAVFVRASPTLYPTHIASIAAGLPTDLAVIVLAKLAFPATRRARFLAILDLAATAWLLATPWIGAAAQWPPVSSSDPAWAVGGLVVAGGAVLLAILWWRSRRPAAIAAGPAVARGAARPSLDLFGALALLRRPRMVALILVMACHLLVFSTLYRVLPQYIANVRLLPRDSFIQALIGPLAAYALVKIAVACWSDMRVRRTGRPATARVPFIVVGALVTATIGLFPLVDNAGLASILWPLALGMATFPLVFALCLDVVPADCAGRFVGLAYALGLVVVLAAFMLASVIGTITHSVSSYFYLAAIAALTAAITAFVGLRRIEPVEAGPGFTETIGKVFM